MIIDLPFEPEPVMMWKRWLVSPERQVARVLRK